MNEHCKFKYIFIIMSLKKEGNQLADTLKLTNTNNDSNDSSFERKFSLLLMDNSFYDDSDAQPDCNLKIESFKSEHSQPKLTPSNNNVLTKGDTNSSQFLKTKLKTLNYPENVRQIKSEANPNCYAHIINYNLVFSQSPSVQIYNQYVPQMVSAYPQPYMIQVPHVNHITSNPLSPSLIYQNSYNNESSHKEVLNMFDYFYKAFSMGQLTSFLCNSQTCTAHPEFERYVRGLNQPASDRMLEMILLSGGLDRIMINTSSSSIIRSLVRICSSNSRIRLICSLKDIFIPISQALTGCQTLILLIKSLKSSNEIELMQKLIAEFAHSLSTHKISYLIVIQFLTNISESNRQHLNRSILKLFLPLVMHKFGFHIVSVLIIINL